MFFNKEAYRTDTSCGNTASGNVKSGFVDAWNPLSKVVMTSNYQCKYYFMKRLVLGFAEAM